MAEEEIKAPIPRWITLLPDLRVLGLLMKWLSGNADYLCGSPLLDGDRLYFFSLRTTVD